MITQMTRSSFVDAFRDMGRADHFSYDGLQALFGYLEEYEEDTGERIELDVISLCCEYSEYSDALEAATEYGFEADADQDEDEQQTLAREWLQRETVVIEHKSGLIIQQF
jgi:hypothetical protein